MWQRTTENPLRNAVQDLVTQIHATVNALHIPCGNKRDVASIVEINSTLYNRLSAPMAYRQFCFGVIVRLLYEGDRALDRKSVV